MPPWPPDDTYAAFKHNRSLTDAEKNILLTWMQSEDKLEGKALDNFLTTPSSSATKKKPDLQVLSHPIKLPASRMDTVLLFEIPFALAQAMSVGQLVFSSTTQSIIHHCNYFIRSADTSADRQNLSFAMGYSPGNKQLPFPEGTGFILPKTGKIIGELHVPPLLHPLNFSIAFQFYKSVKPIDYKLSLLNIPNLKPTGLLKLVIPADTVISYSGSVFLDHDEILTHINPHMHLLGKNAEAFAITPSQDTIPLIRINNWQFDWQEFYEFKNPIALQAGTRIVLRMTYDNTSSNLLNPNHPPVEVTEGWFVGQEMFTLLMLAKVKQNN